MIDLFMEKAKENLKNDGHLVPIAFMLIKDKLLMIPIRYQEDAKEQFFISLGAACKKENGTQILLVLDVAARFLDGMTPDQLKYFKENMATETPLTYPEGSPVRQEAIMVHLYDMTQKDYKVDASNMAIQVYHKDKTGEIVFDDLDKDILPEGTQFDGLILDCLRAGYAMDPSMFISDDPN
jgi:hypothetical protein